MRNILITAAAGAALAITPALAAKPADRPDHPTHPPKPAKCKILTVGYNAKGTLVDASGLAQSQGADTPTDKSDDRWSGDLTVTVTKANHKAPKGDATYTLDNARVSFYDAAADGSDDTPAPGDTVRVHGKITKNKKKCDGPTWTYNVRSVSFQQAAPAPAAPTS